jgi:hypothetical protein
MAVALADVWDPSDDSLGSQNELLHGSVQAHELGPGGVSDSYLRDQDFYRIGGRPFSSYEVRLEAGSHDITSSLELLRYQGGVPVQFGGPTHLGSSLSMRWQNSVSSNVYDTVIRVTGTTLCAPCSSAKSTYVIRAFDTTYSIPRFNNSATQTTVALIQNTAGHAVGGALHFHAADGTPLGSHPFALAPRQLLVVNTSTLAFASGTSGSIRVTNDGVYGDLSGKAVAVEPATGFTFDTTMVARPF